MLKTSLWSNRQEPTCPLGCFLLQITVQDVHHQELPKYQMLLKDHQVQPCVPQKILLES